MTRKNRLKLIVAAVAVAAISAVGCNNPAGDNNNVNGNGNRTPVAGHYAFGNLAQIAGSVTAVTITPNPGASPGAVVNVRYNGSTEIPQTTGTFTVTFDVAAAEGWNAATGLSAGTLVVELAEPPPGTERLHLANGAYAIFRFDLPPGTVWADFSHISADYMLDEANMAKPIRHWRLMGNWREEHFSEVSEYGWRAVFLDDRFTNEFGTGTWNGPFIMHNNMGAPDWASLGAVADEWFTVTYDITGATAHAQFDRANALPRPDEAGPFFFGLGISGDDMENGVTQYIRNVTLHNRTYPSFSAVSTGSGFEEPTFAAFSYPSMLSTRVAGPPLTQNRFASVLATGEWSAVTDARDGGSSTNEMTEVEIGGAPAWHFAGEVTTQFLWGFAYMRLEPDEPTLAQLAKMEAISFMVLGDGRRYTIRLQTSNVADYGYFEFHFDTVAGVATRITVPMRHFMQPLWATPVGQLRQDLLTTVSWQTHESWRPGAFELTLWDVRMYVPET